MTDTAFSAPAAEPAARRAPLDPAAVRSGRVIAAVHGVYFTLTGVWPIVHMPSFLAVTGPKTDLWLVRTVGVLVCIPGLMMLRAWRTGRIGGETLFAGCAAAAGLMVVDAVAVPTVPLRPVYLVDLVLEAALLAAWLVWDVRHATGRRRALLQELGLVRPAQTGAAHQ